MSLTAVADTRGQVVPRIADRTGGSRSSGQAARSRTDQTADSAQVVASGTGRTGVGGTGGTVGSRTGGAGRRGEVVARIAGRTGADVADHCSCGRAASERAYSTRTSRQCVPGVAGRAVSVNIRYHEAVLSVLYACNAHQVVSVAQRSVVVVLALRRRVLVGAADSPRNVARTQLTHFVRVQEVSVRTLRAHHEVVARHAVSTTR